MQGAGRAREGVCAGLCPPGLGRQLGSPPRTPAVPGRVDAPPSSETGSSCSGVISEDLGQKRDRRELPSSHCVSTVSGVSCAHLLLNTDISILNSLIPTKVYVFESILVVYLFLQIVHFLS